MKHKFLWKKYTGKIIPPCGVDLLVVLPSGKRFLENFEHGSECWWPHGTHYMPWPSFEDCDKAKDERNELASLRGFYRGISRL